MQDNYGVFEQNPIDKDFQEWHFENAKEDVYWDDPRLARITRFRMLGERGFPLYDISYCWGILKDGTPVDVILPFGQLTKRVWKSELTEYAKADKVYAKGLGFFDPMIVSILV